MLLILYFGSQYTQLIARRIRELHVYCEIHPFNVGPETVRRLDPEGVILSGGPASVYDEGAPLPSLSLLEAGVPVLGICYGMQAMAYLLGGKVEPSAHREYGRAEVTLQQPSPLFEGVAPDTSSGQLTVWMSHGDTVLAPPPGFRQLATTPNTPVAVMAAADRRLKSFRHFTCHRQTP